MHIHVHMKRKHLLRSMHNSHVSFVVPIHSLFSLKYLCRNGKMDIKFLNIVSQRTVLLCYFFLTLMKIKYHNANVKSEQSFINEINLLFVI